MRLEQHFGSDAGSPIKAELAAGKVVLTGVMADGKHIAEAVRLVTGVESRFALDSTRWNSLGRPRAGKGTSPLLA